MTNADIIFIESQKLAEKGIIQYTGRHIVCVDANGNKRTVKETEPIHTYSVWKELGFQVQKGQKAVAQITIWKYKAGKHNEETDTDETSRMFLKRASFFTRKQVEAIA